MTEKELDELERLEKAATKGNWWREECAEHGEQLLKYKYDDVPTWLAESSCHKDSVANFDLIVALRNACPCLLSLARIGLAAVEAEVVNAKDEYTPDEWLTAETKRDDLARAYLARKDGGR